VRCICGVLPDFLGEEILFLVTARPVNPPALFRGFSKKKRTRGHLPRVLLTLPLKTSFLFLQVLRDFFSKCRYHIKKVTNHPVIRLLEDRSVGVLIDGHDHL